MTPETSPVRPILYAEDDENDAFLMRLALKRAGIERPIVVVPDGMQAIRALEEAGRAGAASEPGLVLLDLNMPVRTGFDVLKWIRAQPRLRDLAVIVLSSSNHQKDIDTAAALGASRYVVKPSSVDDLVKFASTLRELAA